MCACAPARSPLLSHIADAFSRSGAAAALGPRAMRIGEGLPIHGSVHGGSMEGGWAGPLSGLLCYEFLCMSLWMVSVVAGSI